MSKYARLKCLTRRKYVHYGAFRIYSSQLRETGRNKRQVSTTPIYIVNLVYIRVRAWREKKKKLFALVYISLASKRNIYVENAS